MYRDDGNKKWVKRLNNSITQKGVCDYGHFFFLFFLAASDIFPHGANESMCPKKGFFLAQGLWGN